jgi:hypothetical protein
VSTIYGPTVTKSKILQAGAKDANRRAVVFKPKIANLTMQHEMIVSDSWQRVAARRNAASQNLTVRINGCACRSDGDHLKVFLARAAFRASPVHGYIGPAGSGSNALFRQAGSFVVYPAADQAHPGTEGFV